MKRLILLLAACAVGAAEPRLAHIFQDGMVLQRERPVPVWGWADPGAAVTVAFAGQEKQTVAGADGAWKAVLDPLPASREGRVLELRGGTAPVRRSDVLVGEVWLAAGQSNMRAGGPDRANGLQPLHVPPGAVAARAPIRQCDFGWGLSLTPLPDVDPAGREAKPAWKPLVEDPPPGGGALPMYTARVLRDALDVPIGMIVVAVPGTNQAAWMARATLESFPGADGKDYFQERFAACEAAAAKNKESWTAFAAADAAWRAERKGQWPGRGQDWIQYPSVLYNTRVHPLAPFALRGVIWHQGEAGPGGPYGERLVAMFRQWRTLFGQDLAVVWGTLSRSTSTPPPLAPQRGSFYRAGTNGELRKALRLFGDDKLVGMAEFYDLGNWNTHFEQKAEAGRRMGQAVLSVAYGQSHLYSGPRLAGSDFAGGTVTLRFAFAGEGLRHEPSIDGISGVWVRGRSGPARWGVVRVAGPDSIAVSHPDIAEIVAVAYGAHGNPHETLFGSGGLPASPFAAENAKDLEREPAAVQGPTLLAVTGAAGAELSVAHVRRSGYVFALVRAKAEKDAVAQATAYVPAEWPGAEVEIDGKPVAAAETVKDGVKTLAFPVPADGAWVIVAERGKAAGFRGIDRF